MDLIIVVMLGLASIATAYASFQAAVYNTRTSSAYTASDRLRAQAQSLYLEANQQYAADAQTWTQLAVLQVEAHSADPVAAADAKEKTNWVIATLVDEVFNDAIIWALGDTPEDPSTYKYPLDQEEYLTARYGGYEDLRAQSEAKVADGDRANAMNDRLSLVVLLLAMALFVLGMAAVFRTRAAQWAMVGTGAVITVSAAVLVAFIPFVGLA